MFKSIRRLHFLKNLTNDGIIYSSGNSNWIQIFRRCSGLMEKKNDVEEVSNDLSFTAFLRERQQEARRSIIIHVSNQKLWENLFDLCNDCSYIRKIYQYTKQDATYMLIEMTSEEKLSDFIKTTQGVQSGFELNNPFLKLKESDKKSKLSMERAFNTDVKNSVNSRTMAKIIKEKMHSIDLQRMEISGSLVNLISDDPVNVTETLSRIYTDLKLNDLGIRAKFLMCRQMKIFCSGFLPNLAVYPFGSSVTGLGFNGCDLDIALLPLPVSSSYFDNDNFVCMHRLTVQDHITVLAELMKLFLVGCSGLTLIRNAKVPIVKYKNTFTYEECDLSLYNMHGVAMSQLLYTMSSIDSRVRPFIIALKFWAHTSGVVNKIPGKSISSFALSLLGIFYLQYTHLLPPGNCLPQSEGSLMDDAELKAVMPKFKYKAKLDPRSLGTLYQSFFKFYSTFDFSKNGICIRTGKIIKNRRYPLFIDNPLVKGLNVSSNVDSDEVRKLHFIINRVFGRTHRLSLHNRQNLFQEYRI